MRFLFKVRFVLQYFLLFFFSPTVSCLDISVFIATGEQRSEFLNQINRFSRETGIPVNLISRSDEEYKQAMTEWFKQGVGPDVIYWQGGERLFQYVKKGQVLAIDSLWKEEKFSDWFSLHAVNAVTFDDKIYGVPISYYQWGFYYRKSVFQGHDVVVPKTFDELLLACDAFRKHGIAPIAVGIKNKWPASAWFDYLNLRINGLRFHKDLLIGEERFDSPKVRSVFMAWKQLIDKQCFVEGGENKDWRQASPYLYHGRAGMMLIGSFFVGEIPENLVDDFGFFAFPELELGVGRYEEAPLDLFMIPSFTKNKQHAQTFLKFAAQPDFQVPINAAQKMIPPLKKKGIIHDKFVNQGWDLLAGADGISHYFDRDAPTDLAKEAVDVFASFMVNGDVDLAISRLIAAQKKVPTED